MKPKINYPYALPATFIWLGFLCAISFMEAWLKFKAPGVTLAIGLGIGKLVFGALNKVEWFLTIIIFINFLFVRERKNGLRNLLLFILIIILLLESFWGLPALDNMANLIIQNKPVPPSNLHIVYVALEVLKLITLIFLGIWLMKRNVLTEDKK